MGFQSEICKRISREHQEVARLLDRLDQFLQSAAAALQPDWQGPEPRRLLSDLKTALGSEIPNHFAIEEKELFPLYAQDGGADMVELLLADHRVILDLIAEINPLVVQAMASPDGLGQAEWETFRVKGHALVTELDSHAEKEEFGLVLALDELMDPTTAKRIFDCYLQM